MSRAVFDASLILKWYLPDDPLFAAAVKTREQDEGVSPSLVLAELGNALWKYVRARLLDIDEACAVVSSVRGRLELVDDSLLIEAAQRLSASLMHPVYDCLYIALAQRERIPLVTVDKRLARLAGEVGVDVRNIGIET